VTDTPKTSRTAPLIANTHSAPCIYFDNAATFGALNGVIEVELTARAIVPNGNKTNVVQFFVAHLRCNPAAADALRTGITQALHLHESQVKQQSSASSTVN
jgi:hypothetical protein